MKRICILSCYILVSMAITSCTSEELETKKESTNIRAGEPGDGSTGYPPISPPKP
ncbi:hypothetical protein [Flavobacterium crassostreae]|uniref:hypothetical protein n=1 Tax=Flavobacterium crassostreae TaxID=1763534 RepID=UPI0012FE765E|nr:hypothetical protein [Flavobacterium crassostreae]